MGIAGIGRTIARCGEVMTDADRIVRLEKAVIRMCELLQCADSDSPALGLRLDFKLIQQWVEGRLESAS